MNCRSSTKGEKREKDYVVQGERMGEVTDTQSKRELIADKPLTVKTLCTVHSAACPIVR